MNPKKKTTLLTKEQAKSNLKWYLFDANGKTLGRFAQEVAKVLIGKHKPSYTPNVDCGDGVVVINAEKIKVTGAKEAQKIYRSYTGYPGGMKEVSYREMMQKHPERIIFHAVSGMMPKSRLGKQQLVKLRIFATENHSMQAQKLIKVEI